MNELFRISELIQELQECLAEYGDLPVITDTRVNAQNGRGKGITVDYVDQKGFDNLEDEPEEFLLLETDVQWWV